MRKKNLKYKPQILYHKPHTSHIVAIPSKLGQKLEQ